MIRPFTFVCMLLAGASGLYLYQSKHRVQMLDRDIAQTIKQADGVKERIGMLRAEWALQNDPDRLKDLVRAHAPSLHLLAPTQFVAMADLAGRLPAPMPPGSQNAAPDTDEPPAAPVVAAAPVPAPVVAQAVPPVAKPAASVVASAPPPEPKPVAVAHHTPPHPVPVQLAATPAPAYRPLQAPVLAVDNAAVAPGTVGAAVLRAMRANVGYTQAPAPSYVPPSYTPPSYTPPSYAPPAPVQPVYNPAPAASVLGSARAGSLPPPTPYAFR